MQGEQVVGIIPLAHTKTGFFSSKAYTLVFTTYRLILAEARKELVDAEVARSRAAAKAGGSGFLGQIGAQIKASNRFGMHYASWDPDAILAETASNVALAPPEIRVLKVDRKSRSVGTDDDIEQEYLHITLETASGKRTYDTDAEEPDVTAARSLVAGLLGPR
jgi:hypothetical protein